MIRRSAAFAWSVFASVGARSPARGSSQARPGRALFVQVGGNGEVIDWNERERLLYVSPAYAAGADGSFEVLYCEAGPLEAARAACRGCWARMPPVIVDLPPPGCSRAAAISNSRSAASAVASSLAATKAGLRIPPRIAVLFPNSTTPMRIHSSARTTSLGGRPRARPVVLGEGTASSFACRARAGRRVASYA
jgi:hypothetical protein